MGNAGKGGKLFSWEIAFAPPSPQGMTEAVTQNCKSPVPSSRDVEENKQPWAVGLILRSRLGGCDTDRSLSQGLVSLQNRLLSCHFERSEKSFEARNLVNRGLRFLLAGARRNDTAAIFEMTRGRAFLEWREPLRTTTRPERTLDPVGPRRPPPRRTQCPNKIHRARLRPARSRLLGTRLTTAICSFKITVASLPLRDSRRERQGEHPVKVSRITFPSARFL